MLSDWKLSLKYPCHGSDDLPSHCSGSHDVSWHSLQGLFQANEFSSAAFVEGRNIFISNDQTAILGKYAFSFNWGAFAALLIATVMFGIGGTSSKNSNRRSKNAKNRGSFIDNDASR